MSGENDSEKRLRLLEEKVATLIKRLEKLEKLQKQVLKRNKFVLGIFVDEVINQCAFALMNWEYLQACLVEIDDDKRIFCHIQAFLVAVANISKILWPNDKFAHRGEELRKMLQVPHNSPMRNKDFRNVFEHYDDRIEKWARSSRKKNYSDMNISVNGFSAISGVESIDCMRNLVVSRDRKNLRLTFHSDSYDLNMTMQEVKKLYKRARKIRPSLF